VVGGRAFTSTILQKNCHEFVAYESIIDDPRPRSLVHRVEATGHQPQQQQPPPVKVQVAEVTGAPSDGNRQLYSGMRRALGSSKIVIVDAAGPDVFTVVGTVKLTPIDEQRGQLVVKWMLKDPTGKNVGDLEQANPVPLAAARGSWAGFGDIVATAASEGILELLERALNRGR